ncbi:MAG: DinB family protein [Chloroflexota bacterium]|nr:DinB family protein [Chloroflexota bacterium]
MDAVQLLRMQTREAHDYLEATMSDVTAEMANYQPPGKANSVGATYAHAVMAEDMVVNGMLRQEAPLMASSHQGQTGVSEPMPAPGPEWSRYFDWTRSVKVEPATLRQYARAVYQRTDEYLAGLTPGDLDAPVDLSAVGMGKVTLGWMVSRILLGHIDTECGEISAIKGVQGARGYPN